jgi:hypothetical protein
MALVQEVEFQTLKEISGESQLFHHWTLKSKDNQNNHRSEAVFAVVPCESLSDRIYVLDPKPVGSFSRAESSDFEILLVKYVKEQWPDSFLKCPTYWNRYTWD